MALGGAQTAVLRYIETLPAWVRDRTTLYCQSDDTPLLDKALEKSPDARYQSAESPLEARVAELAVQVSQMAPLTLRATKEALRRNRRIELKLTNR